MIILSLEVRAQKLKAEDIIAHKAVIVTTVAEDKEVTIGVNIVEVYHQKALTADEVATIMTGLSKDSKMTMMPLQQLDVDSKADAERQSEITGARMEEVTKKAET